MRARHLFILLAAVGSVLAAQAFQPIPKESAKALGATRSKPFTAGMVFVNGKYIEPPYTVERWGTGIRINKIPVTGQVIDWNEFLKTQADVKVEKRDAAAESASAPAAAAVQPTPAKPATVASVAEEMSALDELFGDEAPKTSVKSAATSRSSAPAAGKAVAKPSVTYVLNGEFQPNDASNALVKRINATRTNIDKILRAGGFIFFGDNYSWVTGDSRTLMTMLETLPELEQNARDRGSFMDSVRAAKLIYLNDEALCEDLYKNRIDYLRLKDRRERIKSEQNMRRILGDGSNLLF